MRIKRISLGLILLLLITCSEKRLYIYQEKPPEINIDDALPVDPMITKGVLDNGLTYYVKYNGVPENRCELRLAVNAGSILEDDDQQGLAHFVEHMAFNGTENFKKHELVDYLESIGMRFGPEINAYTSFDETIYMLQLATDSMDVVKTGFQVLYDWAHLVAFDSIEIERERGVVIEEWRLGQGADNRMRDKQLPVLFKGSKYANRLPIGQKAVLDTFKHETLKSFYKDWYRPDLMAVMAVGDFDPEEIEQIIIDKFSNIPAKKSPKERIDFTVPDNKETLFAIASDPEATQSSISIYYKLPDEKEQTVRDYRRMLIGHLYNGMFNQRLAELAQQSDPPYLFAYSGDGRFVRGRNFYTLSAMVKDNGIPLAMQTLLEEAKRVKDFGFTETELEREKLNLLRGMEKLFRERTQMNSNAFAAEYIRNFMFDEPIPGITYEYYIFQQFVPGISLNEVNGLANYWISDSNRVVLADYPEKEGIDPLNEELLNTIIETIDSSKVDPYIDDTLDQPLLSEKPVGTKIKEEKDIDEIEVTELTLENGIRVILKPTLFKNDEIRFTAYSPGGLSLVSTEDIVPGRTATSVLGQSGIGEFTAIQLEKLLAGKAVNVSPSIGQLTEGFSGNASPDDLEILFQLIYLSFTSPRVDSTVFISLQTRLSAYYQNQAMDPETAFDDSINAITTQYHPRYKPFNLEAISEMDMQKSLEIYRDRFADAGDFTFIFVGNFELDKIKPLIETYLGGLPVINRHESWDTSTYDFPSGIKECIIKKGIEPKSQNSITFSGDFEWNSENRYIARSMLDVLRIKLRERIREDMSGTYGVGVSGSFDHYPKERYEIEISFGCDPERVDELTREVFLQIDSLSQFGTSNEYLQKVTETQRRQFELSLKSNSFWLNNLEYRYFNNLDPAGILDYLDLVESLALNDIQQAAQKYFNFNNYVRVVLLPEN
ncbi:MAG: insulinase family protein [Calditrichaceae bacterium]|nr:insulinase family protein [Calditrichaceae bacterium]